MCGILNYPPVLLANPLNEFWLFFRDCSGIQSKFSFIILFNNFQPMFNCFKASVLLSYSIPKIVIDLDWPLYLPERTYCGNIILSTYLY